MVASHTEDTYLLFKQQLGKHLIKKLYGLRRRHGPIIDIPGDDDRFRPAVRYHPQEIHQHIGLILRQMHSTEIPPQMPVRCMNESQNYSLPKHEKGAAATAGPSV